MQSRFFLLFVLVSTFCVSHVNCQSRGEDGFWPALKKMVKEFIEPLRDIWNHMKTEIKSRTEDMSSWTLEMLDSFKVKMKKWVDQLSGAPESEKNDMRNFIERLQMPNEQ